MLSWGLTDIGAHRQVLLGHLITHPTPTPAETWGQERRGDPRVDMKTDLTKQPNEYQMLRYAKLYSAQQMYRGHHYQESGSWEQHGKQAPADMGRSRRKRKKEQSKQFAVFSKLHLLQ